jgi:hypothetical protein
MDLFWYLLKGFGYEMIQNCCTHLPLKKNRPIYYYLGAKIPEATILYNASISTQYPCLLRQGHKVNQKKKIINSL